MNERPTKKAKHKDRADEATPSTAIGSRLMPLTEVLDFVIKSSANRLIWPRCTNKVSQELALETAIAMNYLNVPGRNLSGITDELEFARNNTTQLLFAGLGGNSVDTAAAIYVIRRSYQYIESPDLNTTIERCIEKFVARTKKWSEEPNGTDLIRTASDKAFKKYHDEYLDACENNDQFESREKKRAVAADNLRKEIDALVYKKALEILANEKDSEYDTDHSNGEEQEDTRGETTVERDTTDSGANAIDLGKRKKCADTLKPTLEENGDKLAMAQMEIAQSLKELVKTIRHGPDNVGETQTLQRDVLDVEEKVSGLEAEVSDVMKEVEGLRNDMKHMQAELMSEIKTIMSQWLEMLSSKNNNIG